MRNWRRRMRTAPLVVLMLLIVGAPATNVWAIGAACRTDPKFFFGNGDKLTVVATVGTEKKNIKSIIYTVHAPVGQAEDPAVKIVYTGLRPGVEQAEVFYDLETWDKGKWQSYAYVVVATVSVVDGLPVPVTLDVSLNNQDWQTKPGVSGELLQLEVTQ